MQQPPQPVPAGVAPPPAAGVARNMYWRNSPLSKRASAGAAPVPPVTDPFAFGRQAPHGSPSDNPAKGSAPAFPQPALGHPPPSRAGDSPHGPRPSLSAPAAPAGISASTFSNVAVPSPSPGCVTNSAAEGYPNAELGLRGPAGPLHFNPGAAVENSFGVHPGMVSAASKPGARQEVGRDPNAAPSGAGTAALFPPPPQQQPGSQWRPGPGNVQSPVRNFVPYPEPSPQTDVHNISQPSVSSSHPPPHTNVPQGPGHQGIPQNILQAPLSAGCEKNGKNGPANSSHHMNSIQPGNVFRQNAEMSNPWLSQPYQEQFYPQPPLQDSGFVLPTAQENNPKNQFPAMSETSNRSIPTDRDPGTLSMFFKGDEAENEEILSSEKNYAMEKTEFDGCQPNSASLYHQPVHPQQVAANVLSQAQLGAGPAGEMVQKGVDVQYFPKVVSHQEAQAAKHSLFAADDKAQVGDTAAGAQYENVENLECIQNQEVLPSEPQNMSASSPAAAAADPYRYSSFPGQMLAKNAAVSHAEGGPNLEAPDSLPHPGRPDSVSSTYSTISHRSTSSSARPPEQVGTFIQQEIGKPDEESSASFFKQIDSSPLGGDSGELNLSKNYHGNLSQPPTPSPPKPTGVFQTSANSSFEPVRSHGVGIKPAEIDQAKMVVELRENHSNQKNIKKSTAVPAASPGNLEQPPDNLETIYMPQVHPGPLAGAGEAGNTLHSGPVVENIQSVSERRSSTRAQGAVKKCDSPATTLWAHNELPNFGGNVLLAPAAPAVYVPAKQTVEVIQPPEEGLSNQQPCKPGTIAVQHSQDGNITFENLENPPKMGEEEALQSQASSGYASLLSSPPTESLQNQPILIAQPNQSYNLAQPINFSISLSNQLSNNENNQPMKDSGVGDKPAMGPQTSLAGGENMPLPVMQVGSLLVNALPNTNLLKHNLLQSPVNSSDAASNQPANLLMKTPLNLTPEGQKNVNMEGLVPEFASKPGSNSSVSPGTNLPSGSASGLVPPVNSIAQANNSANQPSSKEAAGALDFTVSRTLEKSSTSNSVQVHHQSPSGAPVPQAAGGAAQVRPEVPDKQHFYQQVTKDVSDRAAPQPQMPAAQMQPPTSGQSSVPPDSQTSTGAKAVQQGENQGLGTRPQPGGPQEAGPAQPRYEQTSPGKQPVSEQPPGAPAAAAPAATTAQAVPPNGQQDLQRPPPPQTPQEAFGPPQNPYYYYRHPYDAYQAPYPPPYPPADPRTAAHLYYMVSSYFSLSSPFVSITNSHF